MIRGLMVYSCHINYYVFEDKYLQGIYLSCKFKLLIISSSSGSFYNINTQLFGFVINHTYIIKYRMSKLTELLKSASCLATQQLKQITIAHKKKLILIAVLILAGYVAKKKLTMAHLLTFIDYATRAAQYIPLPEAPKLRIIAEYEHPATNPLRAILQAIRLSEIRERISRKETTWDELKESIIIGTVATLVTYNAQSLYFLVQTKYRQDFQQLSAGTQFDQAMYTIRKGFVDQIPQLFSYLRLTLSAEIHKIQLLRNYNAEELQNLFKGLIERVFSDKFNMEGEVRKNSISGRSSDAKNRLLTVYEQTHQKKSVFLNVMGAVTRVLAGVIRVYEWFPEPKVELTTERYQLAKCAYLLSLKKADVETIQWPSPASRDLFQLVQEQMQELVLSLNFSMLLRSYADYNIRILMTRVNLLMAKNKRSIFKISEFLPSLYKILQEQFLKVNQYELRDKFHDSELKKALRTVAQNEEAMLDENVSLEEMILAEVQCKQSFQFLQKQLELKYFNERSGLVIRPRKGGEKGGESGEMQKLLSMMGGSEVLNSSD